MDMSVEVDMAEIEIDREDVHDRKNVMKRKSNHTQYGYRSGGSTEFA